MKTSILQFVFFLIFNLITLGKAHALLPESGWWWNPSESGRGFNLEVQDDGLYFSTFIYNPDGSQQWYTAYGQITAAGEFSGTLTTFRDGQCIECTYRSPQIQPSPGNVSIKFTSESAGTLTWLGRSTSIQRFAFTAQQPGTNKFLLGEWALVNGSTSVPVYFGERITFKETSTIDGQNVAVGNRSGRSGSTNIALGAVDDGDYYILLDSSTSYYTAFLFTAGGLNSGIGTSWTFLKSSGPSGSGLPVVAFRMSGAKAAAGGNAPRIITRSLNAPNEVDADLILESRALLEEKNQTNQINEFNEKEIAKIEKLVHTFRMLK